MPVRGLALAFGVLSAALLAGCGSSALPTTTPTPLPKKTADVAAIQSKQSTAVAASNATAIAVQRVAQTAVAKLQTTAGAQTRSQQAANKQATAQARPTEIPPPVQPTAAPAQAPPPTQIVRIAPTSTPRPVHHVAPTPRPTPHHVTVRHTSSGVITLASVSCCTNGEFKGAAERRSNQFVVGGRWTLRWKTTCGKLPNGSAAVIYIAIIPKGSTQPIQLIQEPMPANAPGTGIARENLHGRFHLDVITSCHTFAVKARGPRGIRLTTGEQTAAIAQASVRHEGAALIAARTRLFAHTKSHSNARAKARARARAKAEARARARYVADLTPLVSKARSARNILKRAVGSVDPTAADFDPSVLRAAHTSAIAATGKLTLVRKSLKQVKALHAHDTARVQLGEAISDLLAAGSQVHLANRAIRSGDAPGAAADLTTCRADITKANELIKAVRAALTTLHAP
jgi:hypothetical protein